jgi:CheY-like chemotaxis protein
VTIPQDTQIKEPAPELRAPQVLIVEDDAAVRQMYASSLYYNGFDVVEAATAMQAVDAIARKRPDAILLDLVLPVSSGLQLAEILKATPTTHGIPIIAVTAYDIEEHRAREAGCGKFLRKPVSPEMLVDAMRQVIEGNW